MRIIGIDPSLTSTGIVILDEDGGLKYQKVFCSKPLPNRIKRIYKLIQELLNYVYTITDDGRTLFGIEGYSYGSRQFAHQLGELGGCLRLELYRGCWDYKEYAPTMVKKFTTGKGNVKKELMLLHVFKKWGFETSSSDLADAYAIAQLRLAEYNIKEGIKVMGDYLIYEQEVLKKIGVK